ncbi:TetR/AcrR family transcriptional regulator [Parapedobacter tibetensis]|uniref:TetR/AcrR family transcriptional regulator n=1 Tax=Parapedobacter tibetensis TaxID=2972951 RepID=UPI00214DA588|nr:TetR/AcrR family transcriptional regulator [Parapedobacter tibetensis]
MQIVDDKRNQIITAALKRFSHFGIAKTALSEIAEDINISKANLYYYYPDKLALVESIVEWLSAEATDLMDNVFRDDATTLELLEQVLRIKYDLFSKHYMLMRDLVEGNFSNEKAKEISKDVFEREKRTISNIFERGIEKSELVTFDIGLMSELYVAIQRGLALFCDACLPSGFLDQAFLEKIFEKQKLATKVFLHGVIKVKASTL